MLRITNKCISNTLQLCYWGRNSTISLCPIYCM